METKVTRARPRRRRLWIAAVVTQLCLVATGAFGFSVSEIPYVGFPLGMYTEVSGASQSYGFFSPGVYAQLRTVVDVYDQDGRKTTRPLKAGDNREVELRVNNIFESFANDFDDKVKFQRILGASLAGSMFATDPRARKVEVRVDRFTAPPRKRYVEGQRGSWKKVYSVKFIHKAKTERK